MTIASEIAARAYAKKAPVPKEVLTPLGLNAIYGWEPEFEPYAYPEWKAVRLSDTEIAIGYLSQDSGYGGDYWKENESGEYRSLSSFRYADDANEWIESKRAEGARIIMVQRYQHGLVHFSRAGSRSYPDMQWDVGLDGIYIPPKDVPDEGVDKYADAVLQEYTDWCNGNVFGVIIVTLTLDDNGLAIAEESEETWCHIGDEWAKEALLDSMPEPKNPSPPSDLNAAPSSTQSI
jgi:hypothetical protein